MKCIHGIVSAVMVFACVAMCAEESVDWPCYHGQKRDNRSDDKGLLEKWPEAGPKLLWTAKGLGHGYSTVSVVGRRIYTTGMVGKNTHVTALDADGKQIWQKMVGKAWEASAKQKWAVPYSGSRATPTIDGNVLYLLSELGTLVAMDVNDGRTLWSMDLAEKFESPRPKYGFSESVLIDGDRLYCCPAGKKAYIVALDKRDGKLLWSNSEIKDAVGNSSLVPAIIGNVKQLVGLSSDRVFSVSPEDGKLLWQFPFRNKRGNNATDVIVSNGLVYVSSGYGKGSALLKPEKTEKGTFNVTEVWTTELLDNHHGGVVLDKEHVFGSGHEAKGWFCLDLVAGKKLWQTPGKGAITYADGHVYCLDEKGKMSLIKANPTACEIVGTFNAPRGGRGPFWAHPVVYGGRLYIRHSDHLLVYDVRR